MKIIIVMLFLTTTVYIYCPRLGEAPRIEEERSRARGKEGGVRLLATDQALPFPRAPPLASVAAATAISRVGWACKSRSARFGPVVAESVRGFRSLNLSNRADTDCDEMK